MSDGRGHDQPWTIARLLAWTRDYFETAGVDSARLCAELLLARALGCERIHLFTRYEQVPTNEQRDVYRAWVRRAAAHEPVAYLLGEKEFFSLKFEVTPDVLIPRPETEVLVERAIHAARGANGDITRILDIGAGSGCIPICVAKHLPDATVCASDICENALAVARRNGERHGVRDRVDWRVGDLFDPWRGVEPFDLIVSNPPYVGESEAADLPANVRDYEPHTALFAGPDGLDIIERLVRDAGEFLRPGGEIMLEVGWKQAPRVRALF
ncbi:MAG: peptide chain release factor N(5)-glutamine methyltransferase, partial [Phycisphaerales bacterium]|nr:peptide chain release factor N(5)-glutamine methyltransferase [Phycisphaerales bacterium]